MLVSKSEKNLLRLAQGQLNSLSLCPRLFQYRHLEQLYSFTNPKQEAKQALGSKFHLLMQQREMGLPIDEILVDDPQLRSWIEDLSEVAPLIFVSNPQVFRESEHYRTWQIDEYLLSVIYDLLILTTDQAQIIDWKTYPEPLSKKRLENSWQTRLYLYVLAETTTYPPEAISMTYWFFQTGGKPTCATIRYSHTLHEQIKRELNRLLTKLSGYLAEFNQQKQFPQLPEGSKLCQSCAFASRCDRAATFADYVTVDRSPTNSSQEQQYTTSLDSGINAVDSNLLDFDAVEEIAL